MNNRLNFGNSIWKEDEIGFEPMIRLLKSLNSHRKTAENHLIFSGFIFALSGTIQRF